MKFQIGDVVTWTSQAAGIPATKTGEIIEVVPPGSPATQIRGAGLPRDHESYVVKAKKTTDRGRQALYWPRVSLLELAGQLSAETRIERALAFIDEGTPLGHAAIKFAMDIAAILRTGQRPIPGAERTDSGIEAEAE